MSKNLKETIDKMVAESIRRILPEVMNEVLLKTIANSGVVSESRSRPQQPARVSAPAQPRKKAPRHSSLEDLLDESAGSDFYSDPRAAMEEATREEAPPTPSHNSMAQRIQSLPPEFQSLAEGISLDDDGGEMWGDDDHDAAPPAEGPPLDRVAKAVGLDFSRMKKVANVTETKKRLDSNDRAANAQFEQQRIKRMREQLNGGKPIE